MAEDEVKGIQLGWLSENGKPGGDLLVFYPDTGKVIYRIVKEEKNLFALWREPIGDQEDPIGRFITAANAMDWAQEIEENVQELMDAVEDKISDFCKKLTEPTVDYPAPVVITNEPTGDSQGTCRPPSVWERVRRFITGGAQ